MPRYKQGFDLGMSPQSMGGRKQSMYWHVSVKPGEAAKVNPYHLPTQKKHGQDQTWSTLVNPHKVGKAEKAIHPRKAWRGCKQSNALGMSRPNPQLRHVPEKRPHTPWQVSKKGLGACLHKVWGGRKVLQTSLQTKIFRKVWGGRNNCH